MNEGSGRTLGREHAASWGGPFVLGTLLFILGVAVMGASLALREVTRAHAPA
jgi:hypothetical protein